MGPARAIRQVTKRRVRLGRTGLTVSTLCFGTGYMGGSVASGARLLTRAYDLGITFWDASDDYGTHPHVAQALREVGRDGVVVATKTYASTAVGARRALTKALRELGVETVDIFLLHAVDSHGELEAKLPALEALTRAKAEGLVRAVGVSSHSREVLARLLKLPEVDVALVVVNQTGAWDEGCLSCRVDGGGAAALPGWSRRVRHEGARQRPDDGTECSGSGAALRFRLPVRSRDLRRHHLRSGARGGRRDLAARKAICQALATFRCRNDDRFQPWMRGGASGQGPGVHFCISSTSSTAGARAVHGPARPSTSRLLAMTPNPTQRCIPLSPWNRHRRSP